ncbi:MAG TPA: glutamate racemase [Candidatus Acidoferrales bacterium]|nr:glutamate racemase [Candidatus Acidoferrales bacterium]
MIGVFDSGFGGLTVHRALIEAMPARDFVYLGDNQNAPYGVRPPIEVLNLTCAALERLFAEGCTLAVVACNTASTVALRWIQQQWLPVRRRDDGIARNVIGIVVPTIEAATGIGWDEGGSAAAQTTQPSTIAVFATRRTVETDCYPIEIRKRRPDITVVQQACPELAGSIERGLPRRELHALVDRHVNELLRKLKTAPECVILGCTHYPLVADLFTAALPSNVKMIHQPDATARALKAYLERHPEYDGSHGGRRKFLSTGFSREALPLIERFWGDKVPFEQA